MTFRSLINMKATIILTLLWVCSLTATEPKFDRIGSQFIVSTNCAIEWRDSATLSIATAAVYRDMPTEFSPTMISNLVALVGFTWKDRDKEPSVACSNLDALSFIDRTQTRWLEIDPCRGWIKYRDEKAIDYFFERVSGIPSEQEVVERGLETLDLLGIDKSQLKKKAGGTEIAFGRVTSTLTGLHPTVVNSRGGFFVRTLDGIPILGFATNGGLWLEYGDRAKLANLKLVWPKVQPDHRQPVADRRQMTDWIREGKTAIQEEMPTLEIQGLVITNITPYYYGHAPEKPQEFIYPFVVLETEVRMK